MTSKQRNILTIAVIFLVTALTIYILILIPGYLRPVGPDNVGVQLKFIIVFIIAVITFIGIPAWFHRRYVNDYSKIKGVWFFALFGAITGAILGEVLVNMNYYKLIMILPYTILMLIYAFFYKRYAWWKVALTTYWGGVIVENAINRAPIQASTIIWVAFFIYPYFATKIWENRKRLFFIQIIKDLKFTLLFLIILVLLAVYIGVATSGRLSPPLIVLGAALPFFVKIVYDFFKKKKK